MQPVVKSVIAAKRSRLLQDPTGSQMPLLRLPGSTDQAYLNVSGGSLTVSGGVGLSADTGYQPWC